MTQDEALQVLWSAKTAYLTDERGAPRLDANQRPIVNPNWCNAFVYATLCHPAVELILDEDGTRKRMIHAGTRVLVTMVSRFGDVGIRDDRLTPPSNGYYGRVPPEYLGDWSLDP